MSHLSKPDLRAAYNRCPEHGDDPNNLKFCPIDGKELEHVPHARTCPHCTNAVYYSDARFCNLCGKQL
jgi:NADH pyrophosphatase NudC (nudix superfamily)